MSNQLTLHHEFRIDTRRTKFEQRKTVFFTSVDPLNKQHKDPETVDLKAPRLAWYKQKKYGRNIRTRCIGLTSNLLERKGSSSIKQDRTQPSFTTLSQLIVSRGEIINEKVYASPRPPPKISFKDNWMKELDLKVAGGGEDSQQIQPNRVRELVKKIESHPHRRALQADLQQNNAYNPFSEESKVMIRDMGNVELFELCETIPKVQCSECLLYWNQGVVYCTCVHLLVESESSHNFHQRRLDVLSIQNYVIKKGRPRSARHGKN